PFHRFRSGLDFGRALRGRSRGIADLVPAEPELVDPERVELFLAIAHAPLVIVEEAHDRRLAETAAAEGIGAEERVAERLVELLPEPARDRNGEPPLSRRRALGRKPLVRRRAGQPLADVAAQL